LQKSVMTSAMKFGALLSWSSCSWWNWSSSKPYPSK
jgi:hypothetical protein